MEPKEEIMGIPNYWWVRSTNDTLDLSLAAEVGGGQFGGPHPLTFGDLTDALSG